MTPLRQTLLVFSAVLLGIAAFAWRSTSHSSALIMIRLTS